MALEKEYLGELVGEISLHQLSSLDYNLACSSSATKKGLDDDESECAGTNSHSHGGERRANDSTGKRLYAGAHVAIRFLAHARAFFAGKRVAEMGCGTGGVGLALAKAVPLTRLLLTDGNPETLLITRENVQHFQKQGWIKGESETLSDENTDANLTQLPHTTTISTVRCAKLYWGHVEDSLSLRTAHNDDQPFDAVLGCELMYYLTEIPTLLRTALSLTDRERGLFFHVHLFRKRGQEQELVDELRDGYGWTTYEVAHEAFLSAQELRDHPEWLRMRALVSGREEVLSAVVPALFSQWKVFSGEYEDDDDAQEEMNIFNILIDDDEC